ncbi:MAG: hypothetical protein NC548_43515 [Lachnospiraceae bacterium]|nr:hypothetical protein [Lachnospiraceae bacterium]
MDRESYIRQIDAYYNKKLSSHALIEFGATPKLLEKYGAPALPLVMQQSTLTKCIRKNTGSRSAHDLPRTVMERLPDQINNPIFLIQDKERYSIALISDAEDRNGNKLLIAIRLKTQRKEMEVNEVKSVYGKTNLLDYLNKHMEKGQLNITDEKKAERLSRVIGLQLPTTLITSNHDNNVPRQEPKVNQKSVASSKSSVINRLEAYRRQIQRQGADESRQNPTRHCFRDKER